jgi:hypothetical protein
VIAESREDAPDLELEELDERAPRAVIVPALPRAEVLAWTRGLGLAGWVVADPADPARVFYVGAPGDARAVAFACTAERSEPPSVVLWLDAPGSPPDDARAGVVLVHKRDVLTGHQWPQEDGSPMGDAAELARVVGRPGVEVGLRALLRRRDRPASELLADFIELTGLPQQALALLTTVVRPPDADVLVAGPRQGTLATVRAMHRALPEPGWLATARRWQWLFPAAVSLYFAIRAVLAAEIGVGQPGDNVGYAVLAGIAACAAMLWGWRGRRSRRQG